MDELLLRYLRKQTTEEENATVEEWMSGSPERERDLAELGRVVEAARMADRRIVPGDPPPTEELIRKAEARRHGSTELRASHLGRRPVGSHHLRGWFGRVAPGVVAAGLVALAVSAGFHVFVGSGGFVGSSGRRDLRASPAEVFRTGPGETEIVRLGNRTLIRLGPDSRLTTLPEPAIFDGEGLSRLSRVAILEGEAFFAVATDAGRAFSIGTGAGIVRVLGSRFYLAARADELSVTVLEGRVALIGPDHEVQAEAGQATSLLRGLPGPIESAPPIESVAEWMDGFLIFHDTPLDAAMREVEQHYGIEVLIGDPSLLDHKLTMWFDSALLPEVMAAVCSAIDARCDIDDAGVVRIDSADRGAASQTR